MKKTSIYLDFLKEKGKPLSEINPGSDEVALNVEDALQALELLRNSQTVILGGDVLSEKNNKIIYAIHHWGYDYHYLNWYCEKLDNENKDDYAKRSYNSAIESILKAKNTAEKLKKKCYVVFVID